MVGEVIGGVVGGLFGDKGGGGQQQTATKEPWEAAAPWLRDLISQGQALNTQYQQNPLNAIQQQGYQNQLGDLDYFRQTLAPQLLGFANGQMNTNYQRAPAGTELGGYLSGGARSQPQRSGSGQSGGLLGALSGVQGMAPASSGMGSAGLMGQAAQQLGQGADGVYSTKPMQTQQAYFSAPQGQQYGQIDWAGMNPFTQINANKPATEAPQETWEQIVDRERRRREAGMGWQPGYGDM